jgi:transposase
MGSAKFSSTFLTGEIITIVTVGIDPAKKVFAVHGVDATGKPVLLLPSVLRAKLAELMASLQPCLIGMEACPAATTGPGNLPLLATRCA